MEAAAGRFDHWDLMLEQSGTLVTFELDRLPWERGLFLTRRLADHRLAYLDYEGHVSGNRGQVIRLDRGHYQEVLSDQGVHSDTVPEGNFRFLYRISGARLCATIAADQPVSLLPFGLPVQMNAIVWDWQD